jgi:hypothetical protein
MFFRFICSFFLLFSSAFILYSQSTAFTYQGKLTDGANPANGSYDMQFALHDSPTGGSQIGATQSVNSVQVSAGIFSVSLDLGATAFPGANRFLQIAIRPAGGGAFTPLVPRQALTSSPYSIQTIRAAASGAADSLSNACVTCVSDNHIQSVAGSKVTGPVATASSAAVAGNVTGVVAIANGGTGSATKNFVDLTSNQTVGGVKTFGTATFMNQNTPVEIQGYLNVGGIVTADQFFGGADGLVGIQGHSISEGAISSSKLADGAVTTAKLAPGATVETTTNSSLLGSLRWDLLTKKSFPVPDPQGIAFDGGHLWIASCCNNSVYKLRASDGAKLGSFTVGVGAEGVAFDGSNIWVANVASGTVTKLRASDGANQGTFTAGTGPRRLAFDGSNIWVANNGSGNVTKLRASDGACVGICTFPVTSSLQDIAFDGSNIWVVSQQFNGLTKLRASDGAVLGTFATGGTGLAFDGTFIWVASLSSSLLTKHRASDGANVGSINVGLGYSKLVFDGSNIWATGVNNNSVIKVRVSDGAILATIPVGSQPSAIAFDGANIWVPNLFSDDVSKIPVIPAFQ